MNKLKTVTAAEMRALDERAIEVFGIPGIVLMENAGRVVADEIEALLRRCSGVRVFVVAGCGNNGGDGFVAARHLLNRGYDVQVVVVGDPGTFTPDACINFDILNRMKCAVTRYDKKAFVEMCASVDVICDALFGIGLTAEVRGDAVDVIAQINAAGKPVLSCDIPSGLHADTGVVQGSAVSAQVTVTMGRIKQGLLVEEAQPFVGRLVQADISLPNIKEDL